MATPIKYKPSQKVNIGVGKDDVNDFARKYNLEVEEIYDILNLRSARQVYFKTDSVHWQQKAGGSGYTLTIPHNGNAVFAVYQTDYAEGVSTMVPAADITMDSTNVTIEANAPFDGFMMYAGLNDGAGMGSNLSDDVIQQLILDTQAQFADYMTDVKNFAESDDPFPTADDPDTQHNSAKHYADAAAGSYASILAVNTPQYVAQVLAMLENWTTLVTDGIFEVDGYGALMPKELPSVTGNDFWELDGSGDIIPVEGYIESEGN